MPKNPNGPRLHEYASVLAVSIDYFEDLETGY